MQRNIFWGMLFLPILAISMSCEDIDDDLGDSFGDESLEDRAVSVVATYQAENRTAASGCQVASNHTGFTGSGFIDFGGNGTWIEWNNVTVSNQAKYNLSFRYAVGTSTRQSAVFVNGQNVGNVGFANTGSWTNWKTDSIQVQLRQGKNTIRIMANTGSGGPNLDKMEISIDDLCPNDPLKVEPGECGCGVPEGSCDNIDQLLYEEKFDSLGGDFRCTRNTCSWTSKTIDVSGATKLLISADARCFEVGQFESADYIRMSYSIDGGAFVTFFENRDDLKTQNVSELISSSGRSMRIKIEAKTSASNETYVIDNLSVKGSGSQKSLPFTESFDDRGGAFKCSKNSCVWTSPEIPTGGTSNFKLSAEAKCLDVGNFEASDFMTISYRFDSGTWKILIQRTDDFQPTTLTNTFMGSGSSLQVRIEAKTSAANEMYVVDKLTVEKGTIVEDTWACNLAYRGKKDGCDCGCGAPDPDCNGRGCSEPDCEDSACDTYHVRCPEGQECFLVPDAFGGKWKDVEKDPDTSHDNLFCWVAGPTNILDWSGWGQVDGLDTTDDIFLYAQDYWPPDNDDGPYDAGDDAYDMLKWFFIGDQPDEDFPSGGGFHDDLGTFPKYCNSDTSDPYVGLCPGDMEDDQKAIMDLLDAGYAAALQLKGDEGGDDGGHVITLWGYSVDEDNPNEMTGVFLTNSDDDKRLTDPPDRLYYREAYWDGIWHILEEDGSPYKYIKYVYGLRQR